MFHIAEQFLAKGTLVRDCKIKKNYFMIFKNTRKLSTKIILFNTSMKKCKTLNSEYFSFYVS